MSAPSELRTAGAPVPFAHLDGIDLRPVPFAIGHFATEDGRVLSAERGGEQLRERRPSLNRGGYFMLFVASIGRNVAVHAFVAAAFLPTRPSSAHQVRHLDGDRQNNRAANLAWGTAQENIDDRARHGTTACGDRNGMNTRPEARPRGAANGNAILTEAQVRDICTRLKSGASRADLARDYGVKWNVIDRILRGTTWSHVTGDSGPLPDGTFGGDGRAPNEAANSQGGAVEGSASDGARALAELVARLASKPHVMRATAPERTRELSIVANSYFNRRDELVALGRGDEALDAVRAELLSRGCGAPDALLAGVAKKLGRAA